MTDDEYTKSAVARAIDEDGGWLPCSGCHETSDGQETCDYPYSEVYRCRVGSGCCECGGIGVTWTRMTAEDLAQLDVEPAPDAEEMIRKIANVSSAVAFQAGVGAMELAGLTISVLAANPNEQARFMKEGSGMFIDNTIRAENGCLSYVAISGEILSPTELRALTRAPVTTVSRDQRVPCSPDHLDQAKPTTG